MANCHPKVKCPKCGEWTRYNQRNLKLFNHEDKFLSFFSKQKEMCIYGGKSIVHFYYKEIFALKHYLMIRHNDPFPGKDNEFFMQYYIGRMDLLIKQLRYYIENDKL